MLRTYAIWERKRWVLVILGFVSLVGPLSCSCNAALSEYNSHILQFWFPAGVAAQMEFNTLQSSILFYISHIKQSNIDSISLVVPPIFPQIERCIVKGGNIISVAYIFLLCSETSFVFSHWTYSSSYTKISVCVVIATLTLAKAVGYCEFLPIYLGFIEPTAFFQLKFIIRGLAPIG
jgi:hypothetical protein